MLHLVEVVPILTILDCLVQQFLNLWLLNQWCSVSQSWPKTQELNKYYAPTVKIHV